jgi:hypothetical protein
MSPEIKRTFREIRPMFPEIWSMSPEVSSTPDDLVPAWCEVKVKCRDAG